MSDADTVQRFIAGSGFPLEFYGADRLHAGGFIPRHGRTYQTANAGGETVNREVDVLAELVDTRLVRPVAIVLECKHAFAPWVVIAGERDPEPWLMLIHGPGRPRPLTRDRARAVRQVLGVSPPLAFRVTEARLSDPSNRRERDRSDPAFDAVRQVLSASVGVAGMLRGSAIVHPVLLLDGTLWRHEPGQELREVTSSRLVWWGAPTGPTPVVVDVVTRDGFDDEFVRQRREELVSLSHILGGAATNASVPVGW